MSKTPIERGSDKLAFLAPILFGLAAGAGLGVVQSPMAVGINRLLPVLPLNPNQLAINLFRGKIDEAKFFDEMRSNGYDENNSQLILNSNQIILDANNYLINFRQNLSELNPTQNKKEFLDNMQGLGFENNVAELFINTNQVFASPQQLVLFLVREVLNPELRAELDLDAETEGIDFGLFEKIGIKEKLARDIWAAHWELPDIATMKTVLHRYSEAIKNFGMTKL